MVPLAHTSDWCSSPIFRGDILFCKIAESEIEKGIFSNVVNKESLEFKETNEFMMIKKKLKGKLISMI